MRTYGKSQRYKPYATAKERAARSSTEWDIRIDVNEALTPELIKLNVHAHKDDLLYALIGGVERPDPDNGINAGFTTQSATTSSSDHVHIALVFLNPVKREEALRVCRLHKSTDEYAVPRNDKFTYAGWLAHHAKLSYKLNPDAPTIYYEYGTLPMDSYDERTCWAVAKILKKFACKEIKARFGSYYDKLEEYKAAPKVERIQSKIASLQAEIDALTSGVGSEDP